MHGRVSAIHHRSTDLFDNIPSPFSAVRYHSLIVKAALPQCLEKLAWTDDGLVMALRHRQRPLWGVQFHPESICTEHGFKLLANFKAITEHHAAARPSSAVSGLAYEADSRHTPQIPSREHQARLALRVRKLACLPDSEAVFMKLFGDSAAAFWLDSSLPASEAARFSFMGDTSGPNSQLISYDTHSSTVTVDSHSRTTTYNETIFSFLQRELELRQLTNAELPFALNCGFIGYLGYELKRECGAASSHRSPLPDARFILADRLIAFDHQERNTYLLCLEEPGEPSSADTWFDRIERAFRSISPPPEPDIAHRSPPINLRWRHAPDDYLNLIAACKRELADGESYELCLTNQMTGYARLDPLGTYRRLRRMNPAPYAAFLRFQDFAILSSSCERFLAVGTDRLAESRPIKGTAPRGRDHDEDRALRQGLESSEKNRAENLMIVDLVRNDLGRVCEIGSVEVPRLMAVESYATVHQLVSTIRGRLRPGVSALDCVRAAFPPGSMTGAPKRRAMEILDRLERDARGIYSGAIGYFGFNGSADLSVVIRTIVMTPNQLSFGTGGAIVALSDPAEELEEIRLKAKASIAAISSSRSDPRLAGK